MTARHQDPVRVHGQARLPGRAAGRTVLFTGVSDLAGALTLTFTIGCVTVTAYMLSFGSTAVLVVAGLVWLYFLPRFVSPYRALVGLEEVTVWRWYGRRTLPIAAAAASASGRRYHALVARRAAAHAAGQDRAPLAAIEWLRETREGEAYRDAEDARALGVELPPFAILAVGDEVTPIVDRQVWLDWQVRDGTAWRLEPERLRAAAAGASIVLVPRTWDLKYAYFQYGEEPILLAGPGSDAAAVRERLRALV